MLKTRFIFAPLLVAVFVPPSLFAVDGVVLINQASALAGNVTPGDAPGFPVTIGQPGSYRLSGNLIAPDFNTNVIEITASNVSIDLNGFAILGNNVCTGSSGVAMSCTAGTSATGTGIYADIGTLIRNITIRNGSIQGMGAYGIRVVNSRNVLINGINESNSGQIGMYVQFAVVSESAVNSNGMLGLLAQVSIVDRVTASGNYTPPTVNSVAGGIFGYGSRVINCYMYENSIGLTVYDGSFTGNYMGLNMTDISNLNLSVNMGQNFCGNSPNAVCPGAVN